MGFSALAGAGIRDAEALFRPAAPARPVLAVPDGPVLLPGVYVVAEPAGDAPFAGMICTSWHHAVGAPAVPCPRCGQGWA